MGRRPGCQARPKASYRHVMVRGVVAASAVALVCREAVLDPSRNRKEVWTAQVMHTGIDGLWSVPVPW